MFDFFLLLDGGYRNGGLDEGGFSRRVYWIDYCYKNKVRIRSCDLEEC